jgi:hypothetical protein
VPLPLVPVIMDFFHVPQRCGPPARHVAYSNINVPAQAPVFALIPEYISPTHIG